MFTYPTATTSRRTEPRPARRDQPFNPWLAWRIETPAERRVLSVAELAECRCPDLCDRDHANE
jgi:hypothetical protein